MVNERGRQDVYHIQKTVKKKASNFLKYYTIEYGEYTLENLQV